MKSLTDGIRDLLDIWYNKAPENHYMLIFNSDRGPKFLGFVYNSTEAEKVLKSHNITSSNIHHISLNNDTRMFIVAN